MKKFLKNILVFTLVPIIIGIPLTLILVIYVTKVSDEYKIDSNISRIYIGDSHIQEAVDDTLIPHSLNVATNSESYYYSYFKLKTLLNSNPSVKKVYLGFSYHNLSNYYDKYVSGTYTSEVGLKYFYLLPNNEQFRLISWNKDNLGSFIPGIISEGILKAINHNYSPFLGGFSNQFNNTKAIDSSMNKRILFQYYTNGVLNDFSDLNIEYLYKIIDLCKVKGVELFALNTPLNNYYFNKIPKEYKEKLNEILFKTNLKYINLSNLKLSEECFIPDGDHVSNIGAEATSIELRDNP